MKDLINDRLTQSSEHSVLETRREAIQNRILPERSDFDGLPRLVNMAVAAGSEVTPVESVQNGCCDLRWNPDLPFRLVS